MAGVLCDAAGRVLLAQRPPGKHLAGLWEFPGGKREPGETPEAALLRELDEELGIRAEPTAPLIRIPWRYGERVLLLDAWRIDRWQGQPTSQEGQALQWLFPWDVDLSILAPADRPILQVLRLPARYAITQDRVFGADEAWRARLAASLVAGTHMLQLRLPSWSTDAVRRLAHELLPIARAAGVPVLLNDDIEGALALGCGVQLKRDRLMQLQERPLPWGQLVGASCHDAAELAQAAQVADFATLSPVLPTMSHPDAETLGWAMFGELTSHAALPVYALGGMRPADAALSQRWGGQGVAGIRGFG